MTYSARSLPAQPIANTSTESAAFALFALAIALTAAGAFLPMIAPGLAVLYPVALIAELILVFTSHWWARSSPLNMVLFAAFPLLSGFTLVPYLVGILSSYSNGATIVLSALCSTASMAVAGAVAVRLLRWDVSWMGRALMFGVLGLVVLGLLQILVPALRTTGVELALSGGGVVIFALFTAYDMQRIRDAGRMGANPFLLALSLYLDVFNLFVYLLRFLTGTSGQRR